MTVTTRALAIAGAALLLTEAVAQAIVFGFSGRPFDSLSNYTWAPYGLVRNNPALNSDHFNINRNGFRAPRDFTPDKPERTLRVMLMGGSVLYSGLGGPATLADRYGRVDSNETIAPYLEAMLRADPAFAGVRIEVINAAVNFNRITEISSAYLADYVHWRPDFVVVHGSVNNFSAPRLRGDFAAGRTPLQAWHPWRGEFERLSNNYGPTALVERGWRMLSEHSAAAALARKVLVPIADRWVALPQTFAATSAPATDALETRAERDAYFRLVTIYGDAMIAAAAGARRRLGDRLHLGAGAERSRRHQADERGGAGDFSRRAAPARADRPI